VKHAASLVNKQIVCMKVAMGNLPLMGDSDRVRQGDGQLQAFYEGAIWVLEKLL
jgi:hypothetical protein